MKLARTLTLKKKKNINSKEKDKSPKKSMCILKMRGRQPGSWRKETAL